MTNRRSSHRGDQQASKACRIFVERVSSIVAIFPEVSMPKVEGCPRYASSDEWEKVLNTVLLPHFEAQVGQLAKGRVSFSINVIGVCHSVPGHAAWSRGKQHSRQNGLVSATSYTDAKKIVPDCVKIMDAPA